MPLTPRAPVFKSLINRFQFSPTRLVPARVSADATAHSPANDSGHCACRLCCQQAIIQGYGRKIPAKKMKITLPVPRVVALNKG